MKKKHLPKIKKIEVRFLILGVSYLRGGTVLEI